MKRLASILTLYAAICARSSPIFAQWVQTNGPYGGIVNCLATSGTNLFVGTFGGGVWRRPLSEMITSVERGNSMPSRSVLEQNYPNPFNPTTVISYQLPEFGHVTLQVYDALGREVATLANKDESAGYKSVTSDASKLSSGVYFYGLQAGSYNAAKKLLLLK
ncbi:MAG: T9SS type A sorting domain-containing protein [Bacteroidota bacterium]